jgi:cell division protease FtsH
MHEEKNTTLGTIIGSNLKFGRRVQKDNKKTTPPYENLLRLGLIAFWLSLIFTGLFGFAQVEKIPYSRFLTELNNNKLSEIYVSPEEIKGTLKTADKKTKPFRTVRIEDPQLATRLAQHTEVFQGVPEDLVWKSLASWCIPIIILFGISSLIAQKLANSDSTIPGFGTGAIVKSGAKTYMESDVKTTFKDVAGVDEAKEDLQEVIGFLKEPARYNRLGGHLPKGILLVGPPGTGKTLLARAVAGEAAVPFFSISGSEFVEMFVGVGAARVRDLFKQAQEKAPCIIFIDELDALGRSRGLNAMGGHDEKEQTLNQLLVEMDGFDPRQGVILLAATNRPEILDQALLRAGRFDRHIVVDRPDKLGREQILTVHLRKVTCTPADVVEPMAAATTGFTGADLANLVNEAVLGATKREAMTVELCDFNTALERIVAGPEKKNRLLATKDRQIVAYHEIGHALVAVALPGSDPIQKVSIIPRGVAALGYTMQRPNEDRFLMSRTELENRLAVLLGGRAAEILTFEDISTGAADDLFKATELARSMVTRYGMNKALGPVTYEGETQAFLNGYKPTEMEGRKFSEETAREIDCAIRELVNAALQKALSLLAERKTNLEAAAKLLLSKESLSQQELMEVAMLPSENRNARSN